MKTTPLISLVPIVFIIYFLSSCTPDPNPDIANSQSVLPGVWNVESVEIMRRAGGVRFRGELIERDTILEVMGTLTIPNFLVDSLALDGPDIIECSYTLDDESEVVLIESIFASSDQLVCYFRRDGFIIDNEDDSAIKKFLDDTRLFYKNYYAEIIDTETVELFDLNDGSGMVRLKKN